MYTVQCKYHIKLFYVTETFVSLVSTLPFFHYSESHFSFSFPTQRPSTDEFPWFHDTVAGRPMRAICHDTAGVADAVTTTSQSPNHPESLGLLLAQGRNGVSKWR